MIELDENIMTEKGMKFYIKDPSFIQKWILFRYNLKLKLIDWFYLDKPESRRVLLVDFIEEARRL